MTEITKDFIFSLLRLDAHLIGDEFQRSGGSRGKKGVSVSLL